MAKHFTKSTDLRNFEDNVDVLWFEIIKFGQVNVHMCFARACARACRVRSWVQVTCYISRKTYRWASFLQMDKFEDGSVELKVWLILYLSFLFSFHELVVLIGVTPTFDMLLTQHTHTQTYTNTHTHTHTHTPNSCASTVWEWHLNLGSTARIWSIGHATWISSGLEWSVLSGANYNSLVLPYDTI